MDNNIFQRVYLVSVPGDELLTPFRLADQSDDSLAASVVLRLHAEHVFLDAQRLALEKLVLLEHVLYLYIVELIDKLYID